MVEREFEFDRSARWILHGERAREAMKRDIMHMELIL
jgi:hypothetical protein